MVSLRIRAYGALAMNSGGDCNDSALHPLPLLKANNTVPWDSLEVSKDAIVPA